MISHEVPLKAKRSQSISTLGLPKSLVLFDHQPNLKYQF
jgi:hypothetical protein